MNVEEELAAKAAELKNKIEDEFKDLVHRIEKIFGKYNDVTKVIDNTKASVLSHIDGHTEALAPADTDGADAKPADDTGVGATNAQDLAKQKAQVADTEGK